MKKTSERVGRRSRVLFGVTATQSLALLGAVPAKLAQQGIEVHVVSSGSDVEASIPGLTGVQHHTVPMSREPSPFQDVKSLVSLWLLLGRVRPDVVVMGTPKVSLLGILAARLRGVPERVYQVRGLRLETEVGVRKKVLQVLENMTLKHSTEVLSVSDSLRDELQAISRHGTKAVVLGRGSSKGVDTERFKREGSEEKIRAAKFSAGLDPDRVVVGYIGRLVRDKGVLDLLGASAKLFESGVDHQLLLVGPEEDPEVAEVIRAQAWTGQVVCLPPRPDVESLYTAMDIFCLPTLREGFPNVVLEASSMQLPVVTTTATGAVDSVVNGVTGVRVQPREPGELAEALRELIEAPARRLNMGTAGREHVVADYRKEDVEARFIDYILEFVTPRSTKSLQDSGK